MVSRYMKDDLYYIEKILSDMKFINKHMIKVKSLLEFQQNELLEIL